LTCHKWLTLKVQDLLACSLSRCRIYLRARTPTSRGGLVFEAHRLLYHSTLGLRVTKKKKVVLGREALMAANMAAVYAPPPRLCLSRVDLGAYA